MNPGGETPDTEAIDAEALNAGTLNAGTFDEGANIVLTGFMGTGKSTVGRALADRLGFVFTDTDAMIEDRHGPIVDIFANHSEAAFREMERTVAQELSQLWGFVIATGGAMMLDDYNAEALSSTGRVFCLTATVEELIARLTADREQEKRPLLDVADPAARIAELLDQRAQGYGRFHQISTTGRSVAEIVDEIIEAAAEPQNP